jgi:hypothetical protein
MTKKEKAEMQRLSQAVTDTFLRFYKSSGKEREQLSRKLKAIRGVAAEICEEHKRNTAVAQRGIEAFDRAFALAGRTRERG